MNSSIKLKRLSHALDLPLPQKKSALAAGADICAAIDSPLTLKPGERVLVPTGFCAEIPPGFELQVRPRSGLALKHGIALVNSPGTIDADYRGEIKIILINLSDEPFTIQRADRIAQLVAAAVAPIQFVETDQLSPTDRSEGGFGSTGITC